MKGTARTFIMPERSRYQNVSYHSSVSDNSRFKTNLLMTYLIYFQSMKHFNFQKTCHSARENKFEILKAEKDKKYKS